jgi:uncharacterized integral membrane protein
MNLIRKGILKYIVSDYFTAAISWLLFLIFRKHTLDILSLQDLFYKISHKDILNIVFAIPLGWIILHLFSGAYFNPYRKSRLNEIYRTLLITILGALIIFFLIVINDKASDYGYYPNAFFTYLSIQFLLTSIGRNVVLSIFNDRR